MYTYQYDFNTQVVLIFWDDTLELELFHVADDFLALKYFRMWAKWLSRYNS